MGIVGVAGPSSSRFTHPLLREALYDDLEARERTRLHRQVAVALESLHRANVTPCLAELAHHWRAGARAPEDIEKAIDYAIRAGDAAFAVFAYEGATGKLPSSRRARGEAGRQSASPRGAILPSRCGHHPPRFRRLHRFLRERPAPSTSSWVWPEEVVRCHARLASGPFRDRARLGWGRATCAGSPTPRERAITCGMRRLWFPRRGYSRVSPSSTAASQ